MRKMLFATLLFMFISFPVLAQVQIVDTAPITTYKYNPVVYEDNKIKLDEVVKEVYFVESKIPFVSDANISIVNQICSENSELIGGYAFGESIYVFATSLESMPQCVVSHELGHFVRFKMITDSELTDYFKLRKPKGGSSYFDSPEELFAEDFRWLFGSENNRKISYGPNYELPGPTEKYWILKKLGLVAWQDALDYFEINIVEGKAEIIRAKQIEAQKTAKGDCAGAKVAHVWAEQIREVIGVD